MEKKDISTDPMYIKTTMKGYYKFTNKFGNLDKMEKFLGNTKKSISWISKYIFKKRRLFFS